MAMLDIRRNREEQGWTFEGTIDEDIVEAFCREENSPFGDIIKVEATTNMLYKHPLLFYDWDAG